MNLVALLNVLFLLKSIKVNSNDHLEFDIATINHEKIPFKVKHKINHTTLSFTNDKVVDFNVAMRKLIESGSNLAVANEKLKAQLESKYLK